MKLSVFDIVLNLNPELRELGKQMFIFKTEKGFPPDFFLSVLRKKRPELQREELAVIVSEFLSRQMEHIHKSNPSEKRIEKLRHKNTKTLNDFLETGEIER